ncbi:MAG: ABC transporter ATP-binding protein [Chloroflexota bacterium]
MIQLKNIVKTYPIGKRELTVLKGIDLKIEKGEMVAIMGPSGSGKSTLLNIIGCLDRPSSGSYLLEGREVSRLGSNDLARVRGQKIGFIFQSYNLLSRISAVANVQLGLTYAGVRDRHLAMESLSLVGLAERSHHKPTELSGGEQQRVAMARALAKNPAIVLADEPTGNLDSKSGGEIMSILTELHKQQGITMVIISHDINVAQRCQRIINIKDGQINNGDRHEEVV